MKKSLLILLLFFFYSHVQSQVMQILSTQATTVAGGININLQTGTGHGAGFISNSFTITGTVIDLNVCYWFDNTLPILYFTHNFFIPLSTVGEYTINIHIMMSQSTETCDNFANPANTTVLYGFMANQKFAGADAVKLYPNPSSGIIYLDGIEAEINRVEVLDISGKIVKSETHFKENKLNLTEFQEGIYFIKIQTDKGDFTKKVVLRK